jgi:hypothetical protein
VANRATHFFTSAEQITGDLLAYFSEVVIRRFLDDIKPDVGFDLCVSR